MKINYAQNPLYTTVELDEHDLQILKLRIKIDVLEDCLAGVSVHLEEGEWFDISKAREDIELWNQDRVDEEVERQIEYMVDSLNDVHVGDCTCVPCSCIKCYTEHLLGINTIAGLSKHLAYHVNGAFGRNNERTLTDAIKELENYNPVRSESESWLNQPQELWDKCLPRWKEEAKKATIWLREYQEKHFPEMI